MTREGTARSTSCFTIGTVALFLVGFLLLVIFGARIYRDTVESQYHNMDTRGQLSYLVTTLRANDTRGAVTVEDGVLVVRDGNSGYAFRIYLHDGRLVEDFYDETGRRRTDSIELSPGGPNVAVNIPAGQWHTVRILESGTVIMECKDGAYEPLGAEDVMEG